MRKLTLIASATLALALSASAIHATSLETYGRLPDMQDVSVSPDGAQIALVQSAGDKRFLRVVSLDNRRLIWGADLGDTKVRRLEWADNVHLLITTSYTGTPGFAVIVGEVNELRVLDTRTTKYTLLPDKTRPDQFRDLHFLPIVQGPYQVRRLQGQTVLFIPVRGGGGLEILRHNLDTGEETRAWRTTGLGFNWVVDSAGRVAADETFDEAQQRWTLRARVNGALQDVASGTGSIDTPRFGGYGPRADTELVEQLQDQQPVWRLLSLKDGSLGSPLPQNVSFTAPLEDLYQERMIGFVREGDYYVFLNTAMQRRWQEVQAAFAGQHVALVSHDSDFGKVVVMAVTPPQGLTYQLVDTRTHQIYPLGPLYAGAGVPLEVKRIAYTTRDGLRLSADLTLPRDRAATNLSLVVLSQGGPSGRGTGAFRDSSAFDYDDVFDWWSQALAEQGYAVFRPNYPGSTLTARFEETGDQGQHKIETDLSDGVSYLAKQGIIDPKRVCIVGSGVYGGYAALGGVAFQSGIYRCAVSYAGIADLSQQLLWAHERTYRRYWDRDVNVNYEHDSALSGISPIKHVDAINVPVLLIHGDGDTVVPLEQGQEMYDALRRADKDVQLVVLNGEDHWLSHSQTRLQMLQSSVAFLREHNPPD
jgi:dipeptidyl aminopeptidase/acylaminoacyl peptidase